MTEINKIEFSVFNSEDIKRHSVLHVISNDLFDKGVPKIGGLCDLRLGTIDREYKCHTCKQNAFECPGHFGHIELYEPVYNILYFKHIVKILQSICLNCSSLLVTNNYKFSNRSKDQYKYMTDLCKSKKICTICEKEKSKLIVDNYKFFIENEGEKKLISSSQVLTIFKKISKETNNLLGFGEQTKPENFIITVFPVPPPQVRPSIIIDSSVKSQDDLTYKLVEIIKTNNALTKANHSKSNEAVIAELLNLLQYHITTYIDNGISGIPQSTQRTGRPIKGVTQRLKAKEGRIRGNLMGKRVDFSARTVITAEPNIDLNELGVPWKLSHILTFPEIVNTYNIKELQEYVNNGPTPPYGKTGAKYIFSKSGQQKDLRFVTDPKHMKLDIGDKVERHIKDGDLVIFNRQPSLHKFSMMGHKIKIMPFSTFRMNLSATKPYNADFDGDEMNIHVPQTYQTKAEISELMMVEKNIVSSQSNKPIIGIIQDALLGSFKMTNKDVFFTKSEIMNITLKLKIKTYNLPKPTILKPEELWTGKQIFNLILPNINFHCYNQLHNKDDDKKYFSKNDSEVIIRNGKLLSGQLCKKSIGTSEGGIIHIIFLDFGGEKTNNFISETQYLVNAWLQSKGFSIGACDIFSNEKAQNKVKTIIENAEEKVNQIIKIGERNNLKPSSFESKINQVLNNAVSQSGREIEMNTTLKNNIKTTVTSGSKGSILNLAQIMGCVGQQNVAGKRVALGYNDRVLPHFEKNDISPESRGFVKNSYKKGLTSSEFFFHAMGGREGVIDTAVKTSETGYIQRRLIKSMEDLQIFSDKTLRNSIGDIVQFVYGNDGMDATYLISEQCKIAKTELEFHNMYMEENIMEEEVNELKNIKDDVSLKSPIHITRLIESIENRNNSYCKLSNKYIYEKVKNTLDKLCIYTVMKNNSIYEEFNEYALYKLKNLLRLKLASKLIRNKYKLSDEGFHELLICITEQFQRSTIQTGEMVGITSGQSLGECTTQMTLNTFHNAGNSSKNVTLGVPRLKELINVSKNIKSPTMILPLKKFLNNKENAENIAANIEYTTLKQLINKYNIITKDSEYSNYYFDVPDEYEFEYCPSMIQYEINKEIMEKKKLTLLDISTKLLELYNDDILVCHNNENCDVYYLELKIVKTDDILNVERYINVLAHKIQYECILQGSKYIQKTYISENENTNTWSIETDGSFLSNFLNDENFEFENIRTNDVIDVYENLGIEAARSILLDEIKKVIEFDGTYVNMRHFLCLVDTMTYKGDIMAITRHGLNKSNTGPLMKCSFEETVDVLTDASIFCETDHLKGVTENIIVGKQSNIGTGNIDLFMNI